MEKRKSIVGEYRNIDFRAYVLCYQNTFVSCYFLRLFWLHVRVVREYRYTDFHAHPRIDGMENLVSKSAYVLCYHDTFVLCPLPRRFWLYVEEPRQVVREYRYTDFQAHPGINCMEYLVSKSAYTYIICYHDTFLSCSPPRLLMPLCWRVIVAMLSNGFLTTWINLTLAPVAFSKRWTASMALSFIIAPAVNAPDLSPMTCWLNRY